MASKTISSLPAETLHEICSLLYDTHKPSLASLSLANKHFGVISTVWLFRHLKLVVSGSRTLLKNLAELSRTLDRREAFAAIHRITFSGELKVYKDDEEEPLTVWQLDNSTWTGHDEIYGIEHFRFMFNQGYLTTRETLEPFFDPLVSIIERAHRLQHLEYNCRNPVPMNLVQALEKFQPSCRLHVEHFHYYNLNNDRTIPKEVDLAKSPVLDSVHIHYVHRKSSGKDDYNYEAMLHSIGSIFPNVKRVTFTSCHAASSPALYRRRHEPRLEWKGFENSEATHHRARLHFFSTNNHLDTAKIAAFAKVIDFASIQQLKLSRSITNVAMRYFTQNVKLEQLQSLHVSLPKSFTTIPEPDYYDPATFLNLLAPLVSLSISGFLTEAVISAIFARHGPRLRSLQVSPFLESYWRDGTYANSCLSLHEYSQLSASCPHLEDLRLPVQRSKSKGDEVLCYQSLARCRKLKTLFIELACDQPFGLGKAHPHLQAIPAIDYDSDDVDMDLNQGPSFSQTEVLPRIGQLRKAFMNCALDEGLARSIWDLISGRKEGCPLDSLKLYPIGALEFGGHIYPTDFQERTDNMSRAYLMQRPVRDDAAPHDVQIQELGRRAREARAARAREHERMMLDKHGITPEGTDSSKVFRSIWPERKESSLDWRDDWTSLPLQAGDN